MKTLQQLQMNLFEDYEIEVSTLSQVDFHAKLFQLLANEQDLKILEELYSLTSPELRRKLNLNIFSLKMSKDSLTTTTVIHSRSSSERWMKSGMMRNGKCLTLNTLEYHRTGNVCLLSDIDEMLKQKIFSL